MLREAEAAYRAALQITPGDSGLLRDMGVLLMQTRRLGDAIEYFRKVPRGTSAYGPSLVPRAVCERDSGLVQDALATATEAIDFDTGDPIAWMLHGSLLTASGAAIPAEASLRNSLMLAPGLGEARHFLAECLQQQGRFKEAISEYQVLLHQKPQEAFNIAQCAELMGELVMARQHYELAARMSPARLDVQARLLHLLSTLCDFEECERVLARIKLLLRAPLASDDRPSPFSLSHSGLSGEEYRRVLVHYAASYPARRQMHIEKNSRTLTSSRTHVAYLSADFEGHAVGRLTRDLFKAHDRSRFKVSGYTLRSLPQPHAEALSSDFDSFRDLDGLSDEQAAAAIAADDVDVLVDLGGYTLGARPAIWAFRPARLQLGWLGFISPHESNWLDAVILDDIVQPSNEIWPYSDEVIRLPSPLLPSPAHQAIVPSPRSRFGLPDGVPLLASFNNTYKLSGALVAAWAQILDQCEGAYLAIYALQPAREGILKSFGAAGGDVQRVVFMENIDHASNLQRMQCCDLMLDAFDYNAGATAIDAIAAELPILCLAGTTPLSRMSASINHYLEMHELICASPGSYVEKAVSFITNPGEMERIRATMRGSTKRKSLLSPERSARDIEQVCHMLLGQTLP